MQELIKKYLNKEATVSMANNLKVDVKIVDVKKVYGSNKVKVEPVAGEGSAWFNVESVKLKK